jgi:hypothetical protein
MNLINLLNVGLTIEGKVIYTLAFDGVSPVHVCMYYFFFCLDEGSEVSFC